MPFARLTNGCPLRIYLGPETMTNAGLLSTGPFGINFSELWDHMPKLSFKKMHLNISTAKCRAFCLGLNIVKDKQCIARIMNGIDAVFNTFTVKPICIWAVPCPTDIPQDHIHYHLSPSCPATRKPRHCLQSLPKMTTIIFIHHSGVEGHISSTSSHAWRIESFDWYTFSLL